MTEQRRILLIGPNGQIGSELYRCAQPLGQVFCAGRDAEEQGQIYFDLTDADGMRSVIREVRPSIILNAAAYTAVDKAEEEVEMAQIINGIAPGILAEEAKRLNATLVHYSTDYVFDGSKDQPWQEEDTVNPLGAYGRTKLAGEQAIQSIGGHYFILRTSWVYGLRGKNFLLTMQRLAREREELRVIADQFGTPTWSRLIAEATAQLLSQLHSPLLQANRSELAGIYHLTNSGRTHWCDFARAIIANSEIQPVIHAITTADYPTPACRPAYSVLNTDKLYNTFGIRLPDWKLALEACLTSAV